MIENMANRKLMLRAITGILSLVLAVMSGTGTAQTVGPDFQRLDGIFDPVFSVVSDRNGYIWAGSTHGLTRYDSHGAVTYVHDPNDSTSLCHNTVNALLCLSRNGGIQIGRASCRERV